MDPKGNLMHSFFLLKTKEQITAFTWAYDDQMIIIASGENVFVGKVIRDIPLLREMVKI